MAKTKIQEELAAKRKEEKEKLKQAKAKKASNRRSFVDIVKNMPMRAKIVSGAGIVLILGIIIVVAISGGGEISEPEAQKGYNVNDKYYITDDGKITFLNGDEIVKSLPKNYVMTITSSAKREDGVTFGNDYKVEKKDNITLYYGTENEESFDEVHIMSTDYDRFLAYNNTTNEYNDTDLMKHTYVNANNIIEYILVADDLKSEDNVYTATLPISSVQGMLPRVEVIIDDALLEDESYYDAGEIVETYIKMKMYTKDGVIYVEGESEDATISITISKIDKLSKDELEYMLETTE